VIVFADPIVDWATIGKVIAAALVASIGVSLAFSLAVLGATRWAEMRNARRGPEATGFALLGLFGVAVCAAAIVGGIIVMSSK
jgi:uncharacterized membrane protein